MAGVWTLCIFLALFAVMMSFTSGGYDKKGNNPASFFAFVIALILQGFVIVLAVQIGKAL